MFERLRLAVNNRLVIVSGLLGVGLVPCPDCGVPLAVHIWPVAAVVWLWRRWRRRSGEQIDLLLTDDLAARVQPPDDAAVDSRPEQPPS